MVDDVMDDDRVVGMRQGLVVWRVRMPSSGVESWTVVGRDGRPVELLDEFLGWLTGVERSLNTVEAYARDLGSFWSYLAERDVAWDRVSLAELGEFAAWARRPAANVVVISELARQVAEEALDVRLVGRGARPAVMLGDRHQRHGLPGVDRGHLRAVVRPCDEDRALAVTLGRSPSGPSRPWSSSALANSSCACVLVCSVLRR
jgi:hypothetical protein